MAQDYISAETFCLHHNIGIKFIRSLQDSGLIQVTWINQSLHIPLEQLPSLEKMVHFYYDMDINIEGIEAINSLLLRIDKMDHEIVALKNRLNRYEHSHLH